MFFIFYKLFGLAIITDPRALGLEGMPEPRALGLVALQTQASWV